MSQTKLRTQKRHKPNLERQNPHTRATPPGRTRAPGTCCVRLLRESRTQNENTPQAELGTQKRRKTNLERQNPHTRAIPPGRTRASHVLRALAPTKPNLERRNAANQTENDKIPTHTRNPTKAHTCPRHVLRALAPRKPNLERGNVASAYFKSRLNTFSTPIVESGPCPGIITVSFDIMRSFERIPLRRVFLA